MKFRVKTEKIFPQSLVLAAGVRGPLGLAGGGDPGCDVPWWGAWCAAITWFISQLLQKVPLAPVPGHGAWMLQGGTY